MSPVAGFFNISFSSVLSVCDSKSRRVAGASSVQSPGNRGCTNFVTNVTKVEEYFVTVPGKGHCSKEEWLYKEREHVYKKEQI